MNKYNELERKLLPICNEDMEAPPYSKLIDITKVIKNPIWLEVVESDHNNFSFFITRLIYKTLILACYWPLCHAKLDYNDEVFSLHPDDILNYITKEDEELLVKIYNESDFEGGYEGDAIELFNRYIKLITLLSTQNIDFPVMPITIWVNYLKSVIDSGDTHVIWGTAYGDFYPVEGLAKVLAALQGADPRKYIPANIKETIHFINDMFLSSPDINREEGDRGSLNYVYKIFGLGEINYILNNRKWANELIEFIQAQEEPQAWGELIKYLSQAPKSNPTKKWFTGLESHIQALKINNLAVLYIQVIENICKEQPSSYPFSSRYNHSVINGLIHAVAYLELPNITEPTLKLAEYSMQKIPNVGIQLPMLARTCIASLADFDDEVSIYALFKLQGDYHKKAIKLDKRILKNIEKAIALKERKLAFNKHSLKKIADKLNNKLGIVNEDDEEEVSVKTIEEDDKD